MPGHVDPDVVEQRILEQSVRLPRACAITGWAALRWLGASYFDGVDPTGAALPVPLLLGGWCDIGRDRSISVSRERFWPSQILEVDGVPCAVPERAIFDEVRRRPGLREPVVALDMALAAGVATAASTASYVAGCNGWAGVPRVRAALALATEDSRSPQESRMRLVWMLDAGLPRPLCNQPVFDREGDLLGYPDLLDPVAGLIGEYDGIDHTVDDRRRADRLREERFRDHGLEYFTVVRGEIPRRRMLVDRMIRARLRSRFLPPEARAWTLDPPGWWTADHGVVRGPRHH